MDKNVHILFHKYACLQHTGKNVLASLVSQKTYVYVYLNIIAKYNPLLLEERLHLSIRWTYLENSSLGKIYFILEKGFYYEK